MDKPKSAAVAKWGAACSSCASSKAKCIRTNKTPGSKCDRCERLEKDCSEQVHRPRKKRQSKPSKTAQLEQRLDSLVDLLKATNSRELPASILNARISDETPHIPTESRPVDSEQSQASLASGSSNQTPAADSEKGQTVPVTFNQYAPPSCICRAQIVDEHIPLDPDDVLLHTFVTDICRYFPFVALRPGISAQELEATRPVLFAAIKMVSSVRSLKSMRAQCYYITKHISEHVMLQSEKSIELLQTILLVVGYYHYHCMMHAQMSNLTALCNGLVGDLNLSKSPEVQERTRVLVLNPEPPTPRTNDERRVICGVWYINSVISTAFQKLDQPKYTVYIDQCVRELEASLEYESDSLLVQLMRIQHLSDRVIQIQSKDPLLDLPGLSRAPVSAYLNAFQRELDKFEAQIPHHLKSNTLLKIHFNTTMLRLWEPPVLDAKLLEDLSNSFLSVSLQAPSTLDIFYRSNAALKSWFEHWLSMDMSDHFHLPMPASAQLIVAVTMLARWAKISSSDPGPNTFGGTLYSRANAQGLVDPSSRTAPSAYMPENKLHDTDHATRVAIANLKAQIRSQPDLYIDIIGVLHALVDRFKAARAGIRDGKGWDNNIWDLAAKKISITKLKLERWTEIVSTLGADAQSTRKHAADEYVSDDKESGQGSAQSIEGAERTDILDPNPHSLDNFQYNNMFAHDLFDGLGLDQNFFYDDSGDYGTIVLNNLTYNMT